MCSPPSICQVTAPASALAPAPPPPAGGAESVEALSACVEPAGPPCAELSRVEQPADGEGKTESQLPGEPWPLRTFVCLFAVCFFLFVFFPFFDGSGKQYMTYT